MSDLSAFCETTRTLHGRAAPGGLLNTPRPGGPLVRFHIGLEGPADLISDLRRGLDRVAA